MRMEGEVARHLDGLRLVRRRRAGPDGVLPEGRLRLGQEALRGGVALSGQAGWT